jgi:anti-anti-sigma factor
VPSGPQGQFLAVEWNMTAGTAVVVLTGELDIVITPWLAGQLAQILARKPQQLGFDMAGVGFLDCAAARLIAGTRRSLPEGRRPVIHRPSPAVRRILELAGLDAHCELDGHCEVER